MYRKTAIFSLIWLTMMILSCASIRQELIRKPDIMFERAELRDMSVSEVTVVFGLRVANPNPMGLNIRNIAYNLNISDTKFIKGISDRDLRVRAAGTGVLELPITIFCADVFESLRNQPEADKVAYELSGSADVGPFTIPYKTSGSLNLPKPPKISLKTIRISEISHTYASVIFDLESENNNQFALAIKRMEYVIRLAGKEFFAGTAENIPVIAPNSKLKSELPAKIDFFRQGTSLAPILNESSAVYEISGVLVFDESGTREKRFSFRKAGSVPMVKSDSIR